MPSGYMSVEDDQNASDDGRSSRNSTPRLVGLRLLGIGVFASWLSIAAYAQNPPAVQPLPSATADSSAAPQNSSNQTPAVSSPQPNQTPQPVQTQSATPNSTPNQNTPPNQIPPQPDQTAPPDNQADAGQFVFKKKVEEVILHAVVVDQQNGLVSNLDQSDFHVYEDGKPQQITSFHQEHVPVALGILIDNSGSMRPKRAAVNQAALNLVRASHPQDEIFVVNFGENYYLDQDFTNDEVKLKNALQKIETRGSTALYDAVVASANHLKQNAPLQKRILLVVTDGDDNASQETLEDTVQQLQQKDGPVVYVIALLNGRKAVNSMIRSLQTLSQKTGGTAYFPTDISQVDSITRNIAAAVRSQYVIGYKSSSTAAGHVYHAIQVEAFDSARHKLAVRTRTGYYSDSMGGTQ